MITWGFPGFKVKVPVTYGKKVGLKIWQPLICWSPSCYWKHLTFTLYNTDQ